jgi:hypothetical protein
MLRIFTHAETPNDAHIGFVHLMVTIEAQPGLKTVTIAKW